MEKPKQKPTEARAFLSLSSIRKKKKQEGQQDKDNKEAPQGGSARESQSSGSSDTSFLQNLMADEDQFKDTLVKMNDQAVHEINGGNCNNGLHILEKLKKVLEYAAENGKLLDRNMIIVCLYNIACAYQMGWVLDKCSEYIDAVVYNLDQSIKQDETLLGASPSDLTSSQLATLTSIKIKKQRFLLKIYLQCCAVLSQLSKHEEALDLAHKAQKVMIAILSQCSTYCREARDFINTTQQQSQVNQVNQDGTSGRVSFNPSSVGLTFDFYKNFDGGPTFHDEVPYLKHTLDYAIPFLNNFINTVKKFSANKVEDTLKQTRKLLFNWKNNPENIEKYLRKEFAKASFLKEKEDSNRSILGLQMTPEWLRNLNIGSFMHMKPLKYREYAEKKELISELSKESLQEKVILQSLIYFSTATEIRFLGLEEGARAGKEDTQSVESQRISEAYHLTAIELVCKYINGVCPYVNHLIASYQKHYNQNLETIPEESFVSLNEEALCNKEKSINKDEMKKLVPPDPVEDTKKEKEPPKKEKRIKLEPARPPEGKPDSNLYRRGSENVLNSFKKTGGGAIQRIKSAERDKEEEQNIKETEERPKTYRDKGTDVRNKKVVRTGDEAKKLFENSLSSTSLTFGSILSKNLSPTSQSTSFNKASTMNTSKAEPSLTEPSEPKFFVKKNFEIPNLGLSKVLRDDIQTHLGSDKKEPQPKLSGFRSERSIQIKKNGLELSPRPEASERKALQKDQLQGGINFYLYRNFNKFIQDLYVKNGGDVSKLKLKKKKDEKETEVKDSTINNSKHALTNKSAGTAQLGIRNSLTYGKHNTTELKSERNGAKKDLSYGEALKKINSLSPRKDQKEILEIVELNKKKQNQITANKLLSTMTPKGLQQLDFFKLNQSKGKIKHMSPRE